MKHPQMMLLGEKGTHGVSVTSEKIDVLLPQMRKNAQGQHTQNTRCISSPIAPLLQHEQTLLYPIKMTMTNSNR